MQLKTKKRKNSQKDNFSFIHFTHNYVIGVDPLSQNSCNLKCMQFPSVNIRFLGKAAFDFVYVYNYNFFMKNNATKI